MEKQENNNQPKANKKKSNSSEAFEKAIKRYLDSRAKEDKHFADIYSGTDESISRCCNYIISEVRKTARTAFANEEIYCMAVHYFDEGIVGPERTETCRVVVSDDNIPAEPKPKSEPKPKPKPKAVAAVESPSLFDF